MTADNVASAPVPAQLARTFLEQGLAYKRTHGMANRDYALVIGIDRYLVSGFGLPNSARNALAICDWLIYEAKVPPKNIILLASLKDEIRRVEAGRLALEKAADGQLNLTSKETSPRLDVLDCADTTFEIILSSISEIARRGSGGGERLFFYFSGHGISTVEPSYDDGLVHSGYDGTNKPMPLSVTALCQYFLIRPFAEQLFVFDCCRGLDQFAGAFENIENSPCKKKPQLCRASKNKQYYIRAAEQYQDTTTLFTDALVTALLRGLLGAPGIEMVYRTDPPPGVYEVWPEDLNSYLAGNLKKPGGASRADWVEGDRSGAPLSLVSLSVGDPVKKIRLNVIAQPARDIAGWKFKLLDDRGKDHFAGNPISANIAVEVYPQKYKFVLEKEGEGGPSSVWSVSLWDSPMRVVAKLTPPWEVIYGPEKQPAVSQTNEALVLNDVLLKRILEKPETSIPDDVANRLGSIVISSDNQLARVELQGHGGKTISPDWKDEISTERGGVKFHFNNLSTGIYRATLDLPGVRSLDSMIALAPGTTYESKLDIPPEEASRLADEVIEHSRGGHHAEDSAEYVSAIRTASKTGEASSVLTLLTDGATRRGKDGQFRVWLDRLGLPYQESQDACEVELLLAVETGNRPEANALASRVELRFWPFDAGCGPRCELTASTEIAGLCRWQKGAKPGPHWLSVRLPMWKDMLIPLALLDGFATRVVVVQGTRTTLDIFQYLVALRSGRTPTATVLCQLGAAERLMIGGETSASDSILKQMTEGGFGSVQKTAVHVIDLSKPEPAGAERTPAPTNVQLIDPMSLCLAADFYLRRRDLERLAQISSYMITHYKALSDSHVIRAVFEASAGNIKNAPGAPERFRDALGCGLPIYKPWFDELAAGVERTKPAHARGRLVEQVSERSFPAAPLGPLWTAWSPKSIKEGQPVDKF